ncbi:hypothetical protein BDV28DRAFT_11055 [Aspergillus coremiiformis]|uniref:Uncharacterized protein n=1 Tax=Aspergillus coremiiformis TaxID=138285 RepID=A0A5N6Z2I3_9EURO|nr:hypothetical protein BDV28DRAFT_11055 [Aspergillus coremiiformis]
MIEDRRRGRGGEGRRERKRTGDGRKGWGCAVWWFHCWCVFISSTTRLSHTLSLFCAVKSSDCPGDEKLNLLLTVQLVRVRVKFYRGRVLYRF